MSGPSASLRAVRFASWVVASLPLLYFVVFCTMAADYRSELGAGAGPSDAHPLSAWGLVVMRLSAHISEATFALPTLWALLVLFAQQPKGKLITQAVMVVGGCLILIFSWTCAAQMLGNGPVQ
ncbi:hypothetical protein BH09VER1_BH09VER1_48160 [soil metagenome]